MNRTAAWPWEKIWAISILSNITLIIIDLMVVDVWSLLISLTLYAALYSFGRHHQTRSLGIRSVRYTEIRLGRSDGPAGR